MFERPNRTERFFDIDDGPGDATLEGLRWAVDHAKAQGSDKAYLVVPSLDGLERIPSLRSHAARLKRDRVVTISGVDLHARTSRDMSGVFEQTAVAVWLGDDALSKLDDEQPAALCAVAGSVERISRWVTNWDATPLRTDTTPAAPAGTVSRLLEVALADLTAGAHVGTDCVQTEDRDSAVQLFKLFRDAGEPYDPAAVRVWATHHGWSSAGAENLEAYAQDIQAGKQLRTHEAMWRDDIMDQWRQEAGGP